MTFLKLTSSTGDVYVHFDHVALFRRAYDRGSIIMYDDAEHHEIQVFEDPTTIANLLQKDQINASQTPAPSDEESALNNYGPGVFTDLDYLSPRHGPRSRPDFPTGSVPCKKSGSEDLQHRRIVGIE